MKFIENEAAVLQLVLSDIIAKAGSNAWCGVYLSGEVPTRRPYRA